MRLKAFLRFNIVLIRLILTGLESIYLDDYEVLNATLELKKIRKEKKQKAVSYLNKLYKKK